MLNTANKIAKTVELQNKINEIEAILQLPNLPDSYINQSLDKIKMYTSEINYLNLD
jgi:hypothetical protein